MNKDFSWKFYLILLVVAVLSFFTAWLSPLSEIFRGFTAVPGIVALLAIAVEMLRDKIRYEREKKLQRRQLFFNLAVTSHMASVAFDKHVDFCEKYIAQMHKGLRTLFQEGPTKNAFSLANSLSDLRFEFRTWLTEDMMDKLLPYEKALRDIGAKARIEELLPQGDKKARVLQHMWAAFSNVIGARDDDIKVDEEIAPEKIINHLQQVLGIQELTKLRQKVITEAVGSVSSRDA